MTSTSLKYQHAKTCPKEKENVELKPNVKPKPKQDIMIEESDSEPQIKIINHKVKQK